MTKYDPPGGSLYGFPKEYKPLEGETLEETLVRDGYSAKEFDIKGKAYGVRFWESADDKEA